MKTLTFVLFTCIMCIVAAAGMRVSQAAAQPPITLDNPTFYPESGDRESDVFIFNVDYINTDVTCPISKFDTPININEEGCNPKLAIDSEFDYHIVFMRYRGDTEKWEIFYQEIASTGTPKFAAKQISDIDIADSIYPVIALDKADYSHIAWIDLRDGHNEIYYARVEDDTGNESNLYGEADIKISNEDSFKSGIGDPPTCPCGGGCFTQPLGPDIACASYIDGGEHNIVHIAWSDARDAAASEWEIYYQNQDAGNFTVYDDDMAISAIDAYNSQHPAIATGLDGQDDEKQIHFVWQDMRDGNWWEIYYEHGSIPYTNHTETRISGLDDAHSTKPDIDCERAGGTFKYIHIAWMDERYPDDPGLPGTAYHFPGYPEIYTIILQWSDDDNPHVDPDCSDCGPKRQSDMWGGDWYGPNYVFEEDNTKDRLSSYPQIVVDDDHWGGSTHIVWWDSWLIPPATPKVMYSSVPNGCNNPATDARATSATVIGEGYPSIAMGPDGSIGITFISAPEDILIVQKSKGKYMELVLTTSSGIPIHTFDMYPEPGDSNAADGISYHVGLPLGDYEGFYQVQARDSIGNSGSTDILSGPTINLIPTLNQWGMIILLALIVFVAITYLRRTMIQSKEV